MAARTSTHNNIDPSWFPQTPEIRYNKGFVVCEFWKTFSTLKSEIIWLYINEKKENKMLSNKPITVILWNFDKSLVFFFKEITNCKIAIINESQRTKYPSEGAMMLINYVKKSNIFVKK